MGGESALPMDSFRLRLRFLGDLGRLVATRTGWFARSLRKQLLQIRAEGTATFDHGLEIIAHDRLDERLQRLPVEVGGARSVDYSKALIVSRFCALLRPRRVLEIGTYRGGMTYHIARNTDAECRIWTLDLPASELLSLADRMIASDVDMAAMDKSRIGEEWRGRPESARITQLWGDSMKYDFTSLAPLDLVYIDGSHAEPWVASDTENAFSLLSPNGAILWDDCYWSDVQRVLGRFARREPIYLFEDRNTAGYLRLDGTGVRL